MSHLALVDEKDFKDVYCVHLLLGPACNMNCRHCSQVPVKNNKIFSIVSPGVKQFLGQYIGWAVNTKFVNKPQHIVKFYGGEPLLHWDLIKKIVLEYTEKYDILKNNNFRFLIISNGLLLSQEIVDFCNQYDVRFTLSYDAPNTFAVRGFVPDSVVDLFNKIKHRMVSCGFDACNTDYYTAYKCYAKKFPNTYVNLTFGLILTFDVPKDVYDFDFNKVRNDFKKLRIAIQLGKSKFLKMFVYRRISYLKNPQLNSYFLENNIKPCFSGKYHINVTLDGNIVSCHNCMEKVGTVYNSLEEIYQTCFDLFKKAESNYCKHCEHRDVCTGGCYISIRDEDGDFMHCKLFRRRILTEFKSEMIKLSQPLSEEDKKWFEIEDKKSDEIVEKFMLPATERVHLKL